MKPPIEYHDIGYQTELIRSGTREDIIRWLVWNDPNGTYTDDDCDAEGISRLTLDEARDTIRSHVFRDIPAEYGIPSEVMDFVSSGFLEVLSRKPDEKTIEFHIPSRRYTDIEGRITAFSVTWIHPDFNDQFCHYYVDRPGECAIEVAEPRLT